MEAKNTTVDAKDVEHHSKLNNVWWEVNGRMKGLHNMNPVRIQFIEDALANMDPTGAKPSPTLDNMKILDVGCGGGILTEALARICKNATGVDASKELIEAAVEHAALDSSLSARLRYVHSSLEEHSESHANKYDAVVASEIIEHVTDPALFVKSCAAVTKPGGSLFITTMNKTIRSWFNYIAGAEYIFKSIPFGTHQWSKFIPPNEMKQLLEANGWETKFVCGLYYNPTNSRWFRTSSTAYSYGLHAIKK